MSKRVKIIRYLDCGIFPSTVLFSNGFTYDELYKHLKKTGAKEWLYGLEGDKKTIDNGKFFALYRNIEHKGHSIQLFYIIFTESFKFNDSSYTILAHEIIHILQFMLPTLNVDMVIEMESTAYLHSHLMNQCLKELRESSNKK